MFEGSADLRYDYQAQHWRLLAPLRFHRPCGEICEAPADMVTDLDSVPRIPLIYSRLKLRAVKAAIIHDALYFYGVTAPGGRQVTRAEADRVMLEAMKVEGVPRRWRWPIYAGVRLGGWMGWNRYRGA